MSSKVDPRSLLRGPEPFPPEALKSSPMCSWAGADVDHTGQHRFTDNLCRWVPLEPMSCARFGSALEVELVILLPAQSASGAVSRFQKRC